MPQMPSDEELLSTYKPVVRFDSHEAFFAHDVRAMAEACPHFRLQRADQAEVILAHAVPPAVDELTIAALTLTGDNYPNHMPYAEGDHFGLHLDGPDQFTTLAGDYRQMERDLPQAVRDKVFGRVVTGPDTHDRWLQYWYFYLYNDAQFAGRFDMHEGDWEMVQFKLDGNDTPVVAVYAQHAYAQQRTWDALEFDDGHPLVYAGRGSHASYFEAGLHRTYLKHGEDTFMPLFWDAADGNGPRVSQDLLALTGGWAQWRGFWGGTKPGSIGPIRKLDGESPGGPVTHGQWSHPSRFEQAARDHELENLEQAERFNAHRVPDGFELGFDFESWPEDRAVPDRLIVTVAEADGSAPPVTETLVVDALLKGVVRPRAGVAPDRAYTIAMSILDAAGRSTAPSTVTLAALAPDHPPGLLAPILHAIDGLFRHEAAHDDGPRV